MKLEIEIKQMNQNLKNEVIVSQDFKHIRKDILNDVITQLEKLK